MYTEHRSYTDGITDQCIWRRSPVVML